MREDMGLPTLGTVFRDAGLVTGAFGKLHAAGEDDNNDLGFAERALRIYTPTSNDYQHTIGLDSFWKYCSYLPRYRPESEPPPRNTYNPGNAPINLPDELIFDSMVADRTIDFMNRHREEPFFLWVGFEKPHPELYAPQRFHDMYNPADMPLPRQHLGQSRRSTRHDTRQPDLPHRHARRLHGRRTARHRGGVLRQRDVHGRADWPRPRFARLARPRRRHAGDLHVRPRRESARARPRAQAVLLRVRGSRAAGRSHARHCRPLRRSRWAGQPGRPVPHGDRGVRRRPAERYRRRIAAPGTT